MQREPLRLFSTRRFLYGWTAALLLAAVATVAAAVTAAATAVIDF